MTSPYYAASLLKTAVIIECPGTIDAAALSEKMATMRTRAPWHLPLFQAVLIGDVAIVIPMPRQSLPMARLKTLGKPAIVLICDDGPLFEGPEGWACSSYACDWAKAIMVNGTGGNPAYYAAAVEKAREFGRLTICDCSSQHFESWRRCAIAQGPNKPMLGIRPPPGQQHPVASDA